MYDSGGLRKATGCDVLTGLAAPCFNGAIRYFFLMAGCDGATPGRNYYTEFVEKTPSDSIVLTCACGKYRFFDKELGKINGIPHLLDAGQCNDSYSSIQIAMALAKEVKTDLTSRIPALKSETLLSRPYNPDAVQALIDNNG